MTKQYRPWSPEQACLLPPSPLEWLPDGHLAFFILELVRELDVSAVEGVVQEKDPRGERPYSPRVPSKWGIVATCHDILKLFRRRQALAMA